MQSIDCMVSQRLIESEDFSLDSQIMHAASSQLDVSRGLRVRIWQIAAYHSCRRLAGFQTVQSAVSVDPCCTLGIAGAQMI